MIRRLYPLLSIAGVTGSLATALLAATAPATSTPSAPPSFALCAACHTAAKGDPNKLGPNLFGVYGKPAARVPGFAYSAAMKTSGIVWTDAKLDQWLQGPAKMVPGTRMTMSGMADPAKRAEIIAYLKARK